jgi:prepilin-type N-terminal cleavage/methylation domain-containing protein
MKRDFDKGFTLIEVLSVAVLVGILSAIAAPSWISFTEEQKLNSEADKVLRAIKIAQSESKRESNTKKLVITANSIGSESLSGSIAIADYSLPVTLTFKSGLPTINNVFKPVFIEVKKGAKVRCVAIRTILGTIQTDKDSCGKFQ